MTLAESQGKKAAFLQEALRVLGVAAKVHSGRAEGLGRSFDCVTLRAVDRMGRAVHAAAELVGPGGWLALMTTGGALEEAEGGGRGRIRLAQHDRAAGEATDCWLWRSEGSVRQLDERQFANRSQVFGSLHHQADGGSFGVAWSFVEGLEQALGRIGLTGSFDCAIAENQGDAEATMAGAQVEDGALLEFEEQAPAIFWAAGLPLLAGDVVLGLQPIDELFPGFGRGSEGRGEPGCGGLSHFAKECVYGVHVLPFTTVVFAAFRERGSKTRA